MNDATQQIEEAQLRRLRRYPEYRDSGIEWLGEIPAHWEVYPLRRRLFRKAGSIRIGPFGSALKLEFMVSEGFKVYSQEHVIAKDFSRGSKYVDTAKFAELAAFEIRPRDLVITMMGSSGRCALVPDGIDTGIMDSHLLRIRLPDATLDPSFLALLVDQAKYISQQVGATGKGAIMHGLNSSIIKGIRIAVPPPAEQLRILDFLDRETAKIDGLVARKERLIELLQEKRTALITRAVTRGLDPDVPMKDSGVEWLGKIPEHWEIRRLKWAITFQRGYDLPSHEREEGDIPVVSSSGVSSTHSRALACAPGIVTGRCGTIGDFYLIREDYWPLNTTLFSIDLRNNEPRFLRYVLENLSPFFVINSFKSAVPAVDRKDIHTIVTAIPAPQEQRAIATFLDRETAKIDALLAKVRQAIDHLKEFRTALISAAVTGKIDVRGEAS